MLSAFVLAVLAAPGARALEPDVPDMSAVRATRGVRPRPESAARWVLEARGPEVLRRRAVEVDTPRRSPALAIALSALVPGAGELYLGMKKRAVALMAVEATAWTGYFVKRSDGLDKRAAYEAFADRHWSLGKLLSDHPLFPGTRSIGELDSLGAQVSGSGSWPGYIPWTSKEEDKQHYYENIGKYDWYIAGWEDWDPVTQPHDTALRDEYRRMRIASNDALDAANRFIWLSVAARAFSLVETILVAHTSVGHVEEAAALEPGWDVHAAVAPHGETRVTLEYRFR